MQIDLHIALSEASAVTGSVVFVVRLSNGANGTIDVMIKLMDLRCVCMGS